MATITEDRRQPAIDNKCVHALTYDVAWVPLSIVNVYLVGPPGAVSGDWILIDAGISVSARTIRQAASERFGPESRPSAILLTHGHFDHVGSLQELAEEWNVPVYAHRLELPYLTGRSDYPPPDPSVGGGMMAYMSRMYSRRGIDLGQRVRPLPGDGTIPGMPGWMWIHTPGHTPGHVSFFRDSDRLLIAGDAIVTTKQESAIAAMTRKPQMVCRPPAYFTTDWHQAKLSVRRLARLSPIVAATGHGVPMRGEGMQRQLEELAAHFDDYAPSFGRYVFEPAQADENGPTRVPPPLVEPFIGLAAGVALGALVGWMSARR